MIEYYIVDKNDKEILIDRFEEMPKNYPDDEWMYCIDTTTNKQVNNPNYNQDKGLFYAEQIKKEANKQKPHEDRCNPSHEDYDYAFARQNGEAKYDPIEEQLDQLYHDIDKGLISEKAKTSAFYLNRKQVKDKYPKKD